MKHYTEYKAIKQKAKNETRKSISKRCGQVRTDWDNFRTSWAYRDYLTKRQKEKPTGEQKRIIIDKIKKEENKRLAAFLEKCDNIAKAEELTSVIISVEWVRSHTWGMNPHAQIWTNDGYYVGSASGCGYDKLSAAVGEALNKSPAVLRALYDKYEQELRKNKSATLRDSLGYGSGYSSPYFEGGVGYSCHRSIFDKLGAKSNTWNEGRTYDHMEIRF